MKGAWNTRAGTPATAGRDERNSVAPYSPAAVGLRRDAGSAGNGATEAAHPERMLQTYR
ncbi:TPA: hypothetical protein LVN30_005512 [Klebsiella oxytoca]|nr:hypothetical protein [Klebsiella oxytoca]